MRRPAARLVHLARDVGGLAVDHAQSAPLLAIAHHDERPVLRIARRGRANGGVQNAGDDLLRHRIGFEPAQGSCGVDGVEQSDLGHREPHVANAFGSLSAGCNIGNDPGYIDLREDAPYRPSIDATFSLVEWNERGSKPFPRRLGRTFGDETDEATARTLLVVLLGSGFAGSALAAMDSPAQTTPGRASARRI